MTRLTYILTGLSAIGLSLTGCLDFGPPIRPHLDAAATDAALMLDAAQPDAALPDAALPDAALPDAAQPDAELSDASLPDAGPSGLEELSTEFNDAQSIRDWQTFGAEGFAHLDVNDTHAGALTIRPALGGWHDARTGGLLYVEIDGDVLVEADVIAGRDGDLRAGPDESFNVAGLMIRDPGPGPEDWLLVAIGQLLGRPGIEGKDTVASASDQTRVDVETNTATLRVCRVGQDVYLLFRLTPDEAWQPAWRNPGPITRAGLPARLQVGLMVNGWNSQSNTPASIGTPDLEAVFSAVRFRRPANAVDCAE